VVVPESMPATVFLSYRQENEDWTEQVRALAERLRSRLAAHGISVVFDQFQPAGGPNEGWAMWSADQVRLATRVVMIISPAYVESMRGHLRPTGGRGAAWEARAIYHELYQAGGISGKFRTLAFSGEPAAMLPAELGAIHMFRSPEDEDDLVGWIRGGVEPDAPRSEAEPRPEVLSQRSVVVQTRLPMLIGASALVAVLLVVGYVVGLPGRQSKTIQDDPEFQRMVKMVEQLQKQLPNPLSPERIEQEAESRKESPERYRQATYYWPIGATIRIGFLRGEKEIQDRVFSIAKEWTKYANVTFARAEPQAADVRVAFDKTGEWSYLGTQSLTIPKSEPTANLGPPVVDFNNELESRQLTLHAFGHVLGLIHEYQTPAAASQVNLQKAQGYFSWSPNFWSREMVEANYRPLKDAGSLYADKPFDPYSVMLHRLPAEIMTSGKAFEPGDQLSPGDIAFIRKLYPGR
jgi:TIR domain